MRYSIVLAAIGLTSCNQTANKTDPNICARPLPLSAAPGRTSFEQQHIVESCIHRWAYRLAKAPGPNREIADATLGACRDALSLQISLVRREEREDFDRSEPWERWAREQAMFRVVQQRAGHCDYEPEVSATASAPGLPEVPNGFVLDATPTETSAEANAISNRQD